MIIQEQTPQNNQINWVMSPKQSNVMIAIFSQLIRFVVLVAGRRFGKTHMACYLMFMWAWSRKGVKVWYVAPTYKQAEGIAWELLKSIIPEHYIAGKNETKLRITLVNGSVIELKGADEPDSLRGPGIDLVIFDEYANIKKAAWDIIRPTLMAQKPPGKVLFIGTPQGFNHFYDLFNYAINQNHWAAFQYTSIDGGRIPDEEIELARREMDARIFRQEFLAAFESLTGRVYYGFDRRENVYDGIRDMGGDLYTGMDFNVDPMTAVVGVRIANQLHVFDEFVIPNSNTQELGKAIMDKYGGRIAKDDTNLELLKALKEAPPIRPVRCYPDPSGKARKTSANVGQTDFTILRRLGFTVHAPKAAPPVVDRYNATNALLCNAAGDRNLLIHPRCKHLCKALDGLVYKTDSHDQSTNVVDKSGGLDHITDALGYLVWGEFNIFKKGMNVKELIV